MKSQKLSIKEKKLLRRYLIWCYKTTKESLDRIDRYYTQLKVDEFILKQVSFSQNKNYENYIDDFKKYMVTKKENVDKKKFLNGANFQPEYLYLQNRFKAIEKAIGVFLGKKALKEITELYEEDMTRRILEAREHT